jgi:hypothetical protein
VKNDTNKDSLKGIGEALGLKGRAGVVEIATASRASYRAAFGWWYQGRVPRYPAVEAVKGHLVALASLRNRPDLVPVINDLWRAA